jgi:hypothetical protein
MTEEEGRIMERRLDFILRDGRKINDAARLHAKVLGDFGVSAAEVDTHARLIDGVTEAVARRDEKAKETGDVVEGRVSAKEAAIDLAMFLRACGRLAFDGPAKKDPAAARECGVGERPPTGLAALERAQKRLEAVFANPGWKKALEARGAKAALAGELARRIAEARGADRKAAGLSSERRKAAAELEEKVRLLGEWTTHFRIAGNLAFRRRPEQADFDPPGKPGVKHKKEKPAGPGETPG